MAEAWGAFQLLERVSESEATENFRAQNEQGELVWLKRARKELLKDEGFAPLMSSDLAAAAQLKHPHVLPTLFHGQVDGVPYLVQPVVAGWTLSDLISSARGTPLLPCGAHRAAAIVKPVLEALAAAHAMSPPLLHRELSPDNVMIAQDGRVLLANFGLARARQRAGSAKAMSRAYVSVEQARGQPVDPRSEVFAAGLLLFELTCGRLPAQGTPGEVISRIASYELEAATAVNPNVDRRVVALLEKALAQAPADRFQTARQFADALQPLVPADAEALIGQWADLIDEEQPTQTAKSAKPAQQVRVPADAPPPPAASAAMVTSKTPATPPARRFEPKLLALGAIAIVVVIALALAWANRGVVLGHPEWPKTIVATEPAGSDVYLDGKQLKEKTPVELHLEPDSMHEISVHHSGMFRSPVFRIQNTKRIDIDLVNNEMHEERWVGGPPGRTKVAPAPPTPATPPAPEPPETPGEPDVAHSASTLPVEVLLDKHFELPMDNVATRPVKKGDRLEQVEGMLLSHWPIGGAGRTSDQLDVFALWHQGDHLGIANLREPLLVANDNTVYLAAVSREGGYHGDAELRHQEQSLTINNLRVPQQRNLFSIGGLDPQLSYCFSLSSESKNFPPLLGTFVDRTRLAPLSAEGMPELPELDGKTDPGPTVLTQGHHLLKHAEVAWFTAPTLENGPAPAVKLRFEVCPEKKPPPLKKKK